MKKAAVMSASSVNLVAVLDVCQNCRNNRGSHCKTNCSGLVNSKWCHSFKKNADFSKPLSHKLGVHFA